MEFKIINENKNIKIILLENDKEKGKAVCYFENTPKLNGKNIGTIGEFKCDNENVGINLLKKCEEILKEKNIEFIVTPMNGNTWNKYRVLKYTNENSEFLLENVNPIKDNNIFLKAGFREIATYTSTRGDLKNAYNANSLDILERKLIENNIIIRKFNKNNYINDLKKIYNISVKSFYRNPFYTEINEKVFLEQYEKYIEMADEDFILIAEKNGKEIGFIFCIPDFNELKLNKKLNTVIVKTVAVLEEYQEFAIGNVMLRMIANTAKNKGFREWIYAFMYKDNTSQKMASRNKTEIIREYVLYGKELNNK